jgi:hypothetical protein
MPDLVHKPRLAISYQQIQYGKITPSLDFNVPWMTKMYIQSSNMESRNTLLRCYRASRVSIRLIPSSIPGKGKRLLMLLFLISCSRRNIAISHPFFLNNTTGEAHKLLEGTIKFSLSIVLV